MKGLKYFSLIFFIFVLGATNWVLNQAFAKVQQQAQQQNQMQQQIRVSPLPTGIQVQNQNRTQTQNQGEEQQIRVQTREKEATGVGEQLQTRSQTALEHMSEVAKQVQQLLQIRTSGGIGEQVREIAREQNQAHTRIQEELNRLDSRSRLVRFLAGTDHKAVKNLKAQIKQNRVRIRQLEQLQTQISNQGEASLIQATIQALIQENASLAERIKAEEQTKGLFGWLFRLFAR